MLQLHRERTVAVLQGRTTLSRLERLELIQQLSELPLTQLGQIEFALDTPQAVLPGLAAPVGERVRALLGWAESPSGVGLAAVYEVAQQLLPSLKGPEPVVIEQTVEVQLVITVSGDAASLHWEKLLSILHELRSLSDDEFLEIRRIEPGDSTKFIVNSSLPCMHNLRLQHQLGWLNHLQGQSVISIEFEARDN